jgi:hypothetical protein
MLKQKNMLRFWEISQAIHMILSVQFTT